MFYFTCYHGLKVIVNDTVQLAFTSRDRKLLLRVFLVIPIVEYNSIIWSSSTIRDIDAVESVGYNAVSLSDCLDLATYRILNV